MLRTHGRTAEAVQVIHRALDQGVNYCDTAPAYSSSQDYYGEALGERRKQIFLASKTNDRTRDGSLRLLDDSLRRLRTDHLDLWQLHDLRTTYDLERIFDVYVTRADEESRGVGLGLPLSRRLARLLGGELSGVATGGAGGQFFLSLPSTVRS